MSSANPSFYDAIEEAARVRPRCSSVSRAALSWSFWLRLEFVDLLFSDKIFGIFNHSSNIRV
jgi:hypothetical protein